MTDTIFSRMIQHGSAQEGEASIEKAGQSLAVRFRGRLWESQRRARADQSTTLHHPRGSGLI